MSVFFFLALRINFANVRIFSLLENSGEVRYFSVSCGWYDWNLEGTREMTFHSRSHDYYENASLLPYRPVLLPPSLSATFRTAVSCSSYQLQAKQTIPELPHSCNFKWYDIITLFLVFNLSRGKGEAILRYLLIPKHF